MMHQIDHIFCPVCETFKELQTPRHVGTERRIVYWCRCQNVIEWHAEVVDGELEFEFTVEAAESRKGAKS